MADGFNIMQICFYRGNSSYSPQFRISYWKMTKLSRDHVINSVPKNSAKGALFNGVTLKGLSLHENLIVSNTVDNMSSCFMSRSIGHKISQNSYEIELPIPICCLTSNTD